MENLRSFARETAGKGWQDLKWGSDGPPQDNTDIARCQATTAAMWRDFMTKNPSASGGGWRNPACRVNAAGELVTLAPCLGFLPPSCHRQFVDGMVRCSRSCQVCEAHRATERCVDCWRLACPRTCARWTHKEVFSNGPHQLEVVSNCDPNGCNSPLCKWRCYECHPVLDSSSSSSEDDSLAEPRRRHDNSEDSDASHDRRGENLDRNQRPRLDPAATTTTQHTAFTAHYTTPHHTTPHHTTPHHTTPHDRLKLPRFLPRARDSSALRASVGTPTRDGFIPPDPCVPPSARTLAHGLVTSLPVIVSHGLAILLELQRKLGRHCLLCLRRRRT